MERSLASLEVQSRSGNKWNQGHIEGDMMLRLIQLLQLAAHFRGP
jgi:hypothetical protein